MDRLFEDLKAELIPLVQKVLAAKQPDDSKFHVSFDRNAQKEVEKLLLSYIGFDWNRGTTGESTHPFTLNFSSKDVRVTNHFMNMIRSVRCIRQSMRVVMRFLSRM